MPCPEHERDGALEAKPRLERWRLVVAIGAGLLSTSTGLLYGHGVKQTLLQIIVAIASLVCAGAVTLVIALALKAAMGWRIDRDIEVSGIDSAEHAESAYDLVSRAGRLGLGSSRPRMEGSPS